MECQFIVESIIERSNDRCERISFNIQQTKYYNSKALECVLRLQELLRRTNRES